MGWHSSLNLIETNYHVEQNYQAGRYTESAQYFPLLIKYIHTLPFKFIGRVIIFNSFPNCGAITHRDGYIHPHKHHQINLMFYKYRPYFLWDNEKKKKEYLDINTKSFVFNDCDYHGIEGESEFRYTVRVDGRFEDWFLEELGLIDEYVWNGVVASTCRVLRYRKKEECTS